MGKVVIDETKCKSCYLCVNACPKQVLCIGKKIGKTGNYLVETDKEKENECIGCKSCAFVCPDLAITEVYK